MARGIGIGGRKGMKKLGILAALAAGLAGTAQAADAPATACTNFNDFLNTSCPMTWNGITVFGVIDIGAGYENHGAPFNRNNPYPTPDLVQKYGNHAGWTATANAMSRSTIGIKGEEEIAPGYSFIFDAEAGFDPLTLQLANGLKAEIQNTGVALGKQSANSDSSHAGQWDNAQGYAGLKTAEFGTLVFGRVNTLTLDGVLAYDPLGAAYGFSPVGTSSVTSGAGLSEEARANTAAKYRISVGPFRAAALVQEGGYELGNSATSAYQGQLGGTLPAGGGKLSVDGIATKIFNGVASSTYAAPVPAGDAGTLKATLSNNTAYMLLARYVYGPVQVSGGYQHMLFQNPSDSHQGDFSSIGGYPFSAVTVNAYGSAKTSAKTLQVFWGGAKYAVTDKLDLMAGYYHFIQSNYAIPSCSNRSASSCAGTEDALSFAADYRVLPKLDVYAGVMFSTVNGGMASGYLYRTNFDPTVGARFRF